MIAPTFCTRCGERLADDVVSGLCPDCLTQVASSIFASEPGGATLGQGEDFSSDASHRAFRKIRYLGNYELQRLIGQGGVAEVYLARQVNLGRHVAVKVLREDLAKVEVVKQRFRQEANLSARLGPHPNIVQVYEPGEDEGRCFFSMEFVDGKSLAELLRDGPIPAKDAAHYVAAVARAIHVAHVRGVVHRDIKPANILIDGLGTPRITDFGMAKDLKIVAGFTQPQAVVGTVNYMAPEQIDPHFGEVGPQSDVYSLGATLYQLLTGSPPFSADSPPATLQLITQKLPLPPKNHNPLLPRDVDTICLKCLEKYPTRRYHSAQELSDELERFIKGESILARPASALERSWRWCARNRTVSIWIGTAILLLVIGVIGIIWQALRAKAEAARSQQIALFLKDMLKGVAPSVALGRDTKCSGIYSIRQPSASAGN